MLSLMILSLVLPLSTGTTTGSLFVIEDDIRELGPAGMLDAIDVVYRDVDYMVAVGETGHLDSDMTVLDPDFSSLDEYVIVHLSSEEGITEAGQLGEILMHRGSVLILKLHSPLDPFDGARPGIFMLQPLRVYEEASAAPRPAAPLPTDGYIEDIVAQVSEDSLKGYIQHLEDYVTRLCILPQYYESAVWAEAKFESFGIPAEIEEFNFYSGQYTSWNVVAEKVGTEYPDSIYIICGHMDSISDDMYNLAPGADDNASGTATVLEAARIFTQYNFKYTVRFICFGAEEVGLIGSEYYASEASKNGDLILGVINLDMILFAPPGGDVLWCPFDQQSEFFALTVLGYMNTYVPELTAVFEYAPGATYSDHASFWQYGYPAILGIEDEIGSNPHYHKTTDLLANYLQYFPFGTNCAKGAIAALAAFAQPVELSGIEDGVIPGGLSMTSVWPNPASGSFSVRVVSDQPGAASLTLYNLAGRVVSETDMQLTGSENIASMDTEGLPTGIYVLRVSSGDSSQSRRVVVSAD